MLDLPCQVNANSDHALHPRDFSDAWAASEPWPCFPPCNLIRGKPPVEGLPLIFSTRHHDRLGSGDQSIWTITQGNSSACHPRKPFTLEYLDTLVRAPPATGLAVLPTRSTKTGQLIHNLKSLQTPSSYPLPTTIPTVIHSLTDCHNTWELAERSHRVVSPNTCG